MQHRHTGPDTVGVSACARSAQRRRASWQAQSDQRWPATRGEACARLLPRRQVPRARQRAGERARDRVRAAAGRPPRRHRPRRGRGLGVSSRPSAAAQPQDSSTTAVRPRCGALRPGPQVRAARWAPAHDLLAGLVAVPRAKPCPARRRRPQV